MTAVERRHCKVCGTPLRHDNESGICHGRGRPECTAARDRYNRERILVKNGISVEPRYCEVCGDPLRYDNTIGVCRRTPECARERKARYRGPSAPPKQCSHPDGCPNPVRTNKLCNMHAKRLSTTGELGPAGPKYRPIVVSAGEVFGLWTTLEDYVPADGKVLCRCECGRVKRVGAKSLLIGTSRSCAHGRGPRNLRKLAMFQPGDVFGRLTVLEAGYLYGDLVAVRCECGRAETKKMAGMVRDGKVKSCGCGKGRFTHGYSRHPLYGTWRGVIGRCTDPNNAGYKDYGAIGRTVCAGWTGMPDGFLSFVADMGERPPGHTLDREDNESGYYCGHCAECVRLGRPANCRWATAKQQTANRRSIPQLTRDRADRDATIESLAAEVGRLSALLAPQKRPAPARESGGMEPLF